MLANFEQRENMGKSRVWAGKYKNLHNLPHWHLECELIYVEKGTVTVSHCNTAYHLTAGNAVFIDSGDIHYIKGGTGSITCIIMFDASLLHEITQRSYLVSPRLEHNYDIQNCYKRIKRELSDKQNFYELKICGIVTDLMIDILRNEALAEKRKVKDNSSIENYKSLLNEIEEKCSFINFEDACSFMGLSGPYFSRFFKNLSGMTFSQYLNIIRLEKAIQILNRNPKQMSITELASACGFDTIRHFNRVFRNFTGFSPRELPDDYVLTSHSVKSIKKNFNPTLPSSELLDQEFSTPE